MKLELPQIRARLQSFGRAFYQSVRHPTRRGLLLTALAIPFALGVLVVLLIPFTPTASDIRKAKLSEPAQILYADGPELTTFTRANREWIKLDEMSPHMVKALVATEDHRFYEHGGIDWRRTAAAVFHTASGDRQGGSTITQQLARNLYPDEIGRAATLTRKLKEAITALKIEGLYSKDEILETYLNTVPFLYNAFGIEMAAKTYFDKPARKLNVLESATLVGMLKGTSYYNPVRNPERSLQRRNTVLGQMVKRGELTESEYKRLAKQPLKLNFERLSEPTGEAPHFTQQLRRWLIDWADEHNYDVYADGLVVHTTLDSRLQKWATQSLQRQGQRLQGVANSAWAPRQAWSSEVSLVQALVRESEAYRQATGGGEPAEVALQRLLADSAFLQQLKDEKVQVQAGFFAMDPQSGEVRAWVGSRDFKQDQFDHVQQARRQPGSTFKPFVYAAAFAKGMKPTDTRVDQAVSIPLGHGQFWEPTDGRPPSGRSMSLRSGLVYSKNIITAQVMQEVGPKAVAKLAYKMGVRDSELEPVMALALGSSPVSLYEMVNAYGTIANGGRYIEPRYVSRIEDRSGKVLAQFDANEAEQVQAPEDNATLIEVMRGVVDQGTGAAIRKRYGLRGDLAGKTGTTQNNADGWFILMHARLVGGAWVGFNDPRITLRNDHWGQGAQSALPIVAEVYQQAQRHKLLDNKIKLGMHDPASLKVTPDNSGEAEPAAPAEAPSSTDEATDLMDLIEGEVPEEPAAAPSAAMPSASQPELNMPPGSGTEGTMPQTPTSSPTSNANTPPQPNVSGASAPTG